jgi:transposase
MTRQQVRSLAGKLMEKWQNVDAVAETLGCHPSDVRRWHAEFQKMTTDGDHLAKEPGRPPKLTGNQQTIIRDIIFSKAPQDMNRDAALWSNAIIRDTIRELFRVSLSLATVNSLTLKWGIVRRHIFRENGASDNLAIAWWLRSRFPMIRKLAGDQKARIFFIHDETINSGGIGDSFIGPDSSSKIDPSRQRGIEMRMLSAICPRNSQRFLIFSEPLGEKPVVAFTSGLLHDIDRPLFLIAEDHYKPIAVAADSYLATVADRLSLFFLPKSTVANR